MPKGLHIAVIEHNPTILTLISIALTLEHHHVSIYPSPPEHVEHFGYDCVVIEPGPHVHLKEFLSECKTHHVPTLILTRYDECYVYALDSHIPVISMVLFGYLRALSSTMHRLSLFKEGCRERTTEPLTVE